jgi:hypothetical protein
MGAVVINAITARTAIKVLIVFLLSCAVMFAALRGRLRDQLAPAREQLIADGAVLPLSQAPASTSVPVEKIPPSCFMELRKLME